MATRFYLRDVKALKSPTVRGKLSTVLPAHAPADFHSNDTSVFSENLILVEDLSLLLTKGVDEHSTGLNMGTTHSGAVDGYIARFTSEPLATQTLQTNLWTAGLAVNASTFTNASVAVSLYVFRPSTQAIVGYLLDGDNVFEFADNFDCGTHWDGGRNTHYDWTAIPGAFYGPDINVLSGDVIVYEFWTHCDIGLSTPIHSVQIYYEGNTDVIHCTAGLGDAASWLEYGDTIDFLGNDEARVTQVYVEAVVDATEDEEPIEPPRCPPDSPIHAVPPCATTSLLDKTGLFVPYVYLDTPFKTCEAPIFSKVGVLIRPCQ